MPKIPSYSELKQLKDQHQRKFSVFAKPIEFRQQSVSEIGNTNIISGEIQSKDIFEIEIKLEADNLKDFIADFIENNQVVTEVKRKSLENQKQHNKMMSYCEPMKRSLSVIETAEEVRFASQIPTKDRNQIADLVKVSTPDENKGKLNKTNTLREITKRNNIHDSISDEMEEAVNDEIQKGWCYVDPQGIFYDRWNRLIFLSSLYIFLMNPLLLAFPGIMSIFNVVMEISIDFIFVVDLILHFFLAFQHKSEDFFVKNNKLIFLNYLTSSFIFDLVGSFPYSITLACLNYEAMFSAHSDERILMFFKVVRVFRLKNIFDFSNFSFFNRIMTKTPFAHIVSHEMNFKIKRFIDWFSIFIVISHNLTCTWIYICKKGQNNWIWVYDDYSEFDLYITSLYFNWLSIFTVGYGDITPKNQLERVYTILMLSLGIMVYSAFITSLGSILSSQDYLKLKYHKRIEKLKELNKKYKIESEVYSRVVKHINYESRMNKYDSFNFIEDLPTKIKIELIKNMNKDIIDNFRFFKEKPINFITCIVVLLKFNCVHRGEYIINEGEMVLEVIFIKTGRLTITLGKKYNNSPVINLKKYEHFGDILILANQRSPINLFCASKVSNLLYLRKDDLEATIQEYPLVYHKISQYSTEGYARLLEKIESKIYEIQTNLEEANNSVRKMKEATESIVKSKESIQSNSTDFLKGILKKNLPNDKIVFEKAKSITKMKSFMSPVLKKKSTFALPDRQFLMNSEISCALNEKFNLIDHPEKYSKEKIEVVVNKILEERVEQLQKLDKILLMLKFNKGAF